MRQVGRYEIHGELGRGAMGIVYRAQDPVIGRTVAIKTIRLLEFTDAEEQTRLRERLFREARSAGMLSHPHIVTIYDIGQQEEIAYIAMEFVSGTTLDHLLRRNDAIDRQGVLTILAETASALDYAHTKGIIHRDVKPGNIMVSDAGAVKVTDFGVAKILSQQMTQTEMVLGTPSYMSPEQIESKTLDGRSDQFALAVITYEILTGEKPFTAESLPALLFRIVREDAVAAHMLNPTLTEKVGAVLNKAMAKSNKDRYATCSEFVNALAESLIDSPNWLAIPKGTAENLPTMSTRAPAVPEAPRPTRPTTITKVTSPPTPTVTPTTTSPTPRVTSSPRIVPATAEPESPAPIEFRSRTKEETSGGGFAKMMAGFAAGVVLFGGAFVLFRGDKGATEPSPEPAVTQPAKPTPVSTKPPMSTVKPPDIVVQPNPAVTGTASAALKPNRGAQLPESALVEFESAPPGAKVTVDDTTEGCTTPCALELRSGRHTLKYTLAGHRPALGVVMVPTEARASGRLELIAGTIMVESNPAGAQILIDGQLHATLTPGMLKLPPGKHKITVRKAGFRDQTREIEAHEGAISSIEFSMAPAQ